MPNTGTLLSCWRPGAPVQLSQADNPRRKLRWTLERVDMGGGWVGVNTQRPHQVMAEGVAAGRIPALAGYGRLRREVEQARIGRDRRCPRRCSIAFGGRNEGLRVGRGALDAGGEPPVRIEVQPAVSGGERVQGEPITVR